MSDGKRNQKVEHILKGINLNKTFGTKDRNIQALKDVDFYLDEGELLGIAGESGSGKSTLLNVISGLIRPDSGELFYREQEYTGKGPSQTGRFLQMIFQDAKSSFDPRFTMERSLLESRRKKTDRDALCGILKEVGLDEKLLKRKASELSGGQCQRMSIARALYSEADILLCDEITSALDVSSQAQVVEILKKLNVERKLSAIFVSHDIALLSTLCTRIMVMKDGQVVEQGLTTDVIGTPGHEYTKLLIESARKQSL